MALRHLIPKTQFMTFIEESQGDPSAGLIAGYSFLCVASLSTAWAAVILGRSRLHYRSFFSVRVLFPLALFILALENASLAASGKIFDVWVEGSNSGLDIFIKAVFVLQTLFVPILLVVIFEITYLVHKKRSVNFCGMYFDEGVRVNNTAFMSCMLRNSIRSLATVLLVMGLAVNFDLFSSEILVEDDLAGVAGWWNVFHGTTDLSEIHLILSLIPTAVLTLVSFYLSIMLWRYGTESSMVVHSSICNPWFYPFFGTLAMGAGQLFGDNLYAIMSNAGVLIFVITILILMNEVDKDMVANDDVACFLVQVAQKGDEIRVSPSPQPDERGHQICEGEEMRTVDDEHGSAVFSDINAVTFDPKHDDDRAGSAPDERPDQDYGSNQCETHKKNADETMEEVSVITSMPDKEIDVDVEDECSLTISAPDDRSGQINRSDQCETLNMNDGESIKEVSFMNSMPDKDSDIEHEPSLPDFVQSVGD